MKKPSVSTLKFSDKFLANTRAYYCGMDGLDQRWLSLCPVRVLCQLAQNNLLGEVIFPQNVITTKTMNMYLSQIAHGQGRYTPHSLRIGGHTFYTARNMPSEFVGFLGRRKVTRASELYYRANARDNILRLKNFFQRVNSARASIENI